MTGKKDLGWLRQKGWTARHAADTVGVSFGHLCAVLRGERKSEQLLAKLEELPEKPFERKPWCRKKRDATHK